MFWMLFFHSAQALKCSPFLLSFPPTLFPGTRWPGTPRSHPCWNTTTTEHRIWDNEVRVFSTQVRLLLHKCSGFCFFPFKRSNFCFSSTQVSFFFRLGVQNEQILTENLSFDFHNSLRIHTSWWCFSNIFRDSVYILTAMWNCSCNNASVPRNISDCSSDFSSCNLTIRGSKLGFCFSGCNEKKWDRSEMHRWPTTGNGNSRF